MPTVTLPTPALVSQRAAQPLPRWALLLLCAAYLLPGQFGRAPWRSADITAYGYMASIAKGHSGWWAPSIAGLPADAALLPYWLGAAAIKALPFLDPALCARLPFTALLAATLALVWYSTLHLARTEAAQPVAFAFGGEADPVDYARALADGAVLATMATLGLLQLGHETTPELVQLFGVALFMWALAAAPFRGVKAEASVVVALAIMSASGAPTIGLGLGLSGIVICQFSKYEGARRLRPWLVLGLFVGAGFAAAMTGWGWRVVARLDVPWQMIRLGAWFLWPSWLLAFWTLWRWRHHLSYRHIAVPSAGAAVAIVAALTMGASDRALMLAVPGFAVLAAFSLPTLKRATGAAIDWFSVSLFSLLALAIWLYWVALVTGSPAKLAERVLRLFPGFQPHFSIWPLLPALAGTLAWIALVRWRTARVQHAIWKSLVLPASGVALSWLLLLTLGLPVIDYARSYKPWVEMVGRHLPPRGCVAAQLPRAALAALEDDGRWQVDAAPDAATSGRCSVLLVAESRRQLADPPAGWSVVTHLRRPSEREESTAVFRRVDAAH